MLQPKLTKCWPVLSLDSPAGHWDAWIWMDQIRGVLKTCTLVSWGWQTHDCLTSNFQFFASPYKELSWAKTSCTKDKWQPQIIMCGQAISDWSLQMIPPCNATWNLLPGQQNHECNHHPNSEDEESSTYLTSLSANFGGMNSSSTLHCRGKNGRSKKIGQTNQKMIHFVPNMYVSGKISALQPGTQTVMIFGTTKKIRKLPKTTRFQDLRVFAGFCGFLRVFCGVLRVYPQSFDALQTFFGLCLTKPKNMQSKS